MIKKILVANRGEIAMRIFRTCRVMNISTVAVYTHVDRGALHVRYAEEAYCISESPEDTSYLKPELILSIAKKTGAAIHPGYGFLSENADFARRCEEEGVIFIGPSADIISKMGIKTEARKIMREAGLPIVPGTETPVQGIDEVKKVANEVGYPIMLKALAGGGGKGVKTGLYLMKPDSAQSCFVDLCIGRPTPTENARCLTARYSQTTLCNHRGERSGVLLIKEATKRGYKEAAIGDTVDLGYAGSNTRRGRVGRDIAHTLETSCIQGIVERGGRIRRLMPRESLRLQGFAEEQIDKILAFTSDAQAYKQAGNSVTVTVIEAIGRRILAVDEEPRKMGDAA